MGEFLIPFIETSPVLNSDLAKLLSPPAHMQTTDVVLESGIRQGLGKELEPGTQAGSLLYEHAPSSKTLSIDCKQN